MRSQAVVLIAFLGPGLVACSDGSARSPRVASATSVIAQRSTDASANHERAMEEANAKADALIRNAERADREIVQVLERSRLADKAAVEARAHEIAITQQPSFQPPQLSPQPSPTPAHQGKDAEGDTMERRAATMFGPTLSSTRTVVQRFSQGYDRYMQACEAKTTQGSWLMVLGDSLSSTGFSAYTAQTETSNATTPECRMLATDVQTDAKQISVNLNAVAEAARTAGIYPGVMRDLYASYGLGEVVSVVVK